MFHPNRMAAIIALGGGLAVTAATSQPAMAAQGSIDPPVPSVNITFINLTGCPLSLIKAQVSPGQWTSPPPATIGIGQAAQWGAKAIPTEPGQDENEAEDVGGAVYQALACQQNDKWIVLEWTNSDAGTHCNWNLTDPAFTHSTAGCHGTNPSVTAAVRARYAQPR